MQLDSSVSELKGIGPALLPKFNHLKIKTLEDLISYYPKRYEDFSKVSDISKLKPGPSTIEVTLTSIGGRYLRRGMHMTQAIARDNTGAVKLIWFNQPYRAESLKKDQLYYVSGDYQLSRQQFSMINPAIELKKDFPLSTARILPKYRVTKGLYSRDIRKAISSVLPLISQSEETLPRQIVKRFKLMSLDKAVELIHFPNSAKDIEAARARLAFNEVFELMLASYLNKELYLKDKSVKINVDKDLAIKFVKELPFKLTDDQRKAIWQIYIDISKKTPMNRLIEGDVGSGKTVVATMAALMVLNDNRRTAFMAPTELLARQHYQTIYKLLKPLGLEHNLALMLGGMTKKAKQKAATKLFIVGTHALISEDVKFKSLSLVIIDEQHRFGVNQRKELKKKANLQPHLLTLSATPIPRSLALTMFGELDISRLIEKPKGRMPITTRILTDVQYIREIPNISKLLKRGEQMYVVCPTIDAENNNNKSVRKVYAQSLKDYKSFKLAMIHGKLSSDEKEKIMRNFKDKKINILVSTTLIEVGIDVPSANIMVIMSSENFGLAQLHQLRGRVGRGSSPAHCYLVRDNSKPVSRRLETMETSNDGFELAEIDLELRGPGAIYGSFQHGQLDLRLAELADTKLLKQAREAVKFFAEQQLNLLQYSRLAHRVTTLQKITNLN